MIDKNFIEKSLALCWKEYSDMWIESYCYFLLSPEFIEKYQEIDNDWLPQVWYAKSFWNAIYEYQSGDEQHLINLLSKIK